MDIKFPHVKVQLTGKDGNAFAIMGAVQNAMRRAKVSDTDINEYVEKAMTGDYNNLLVVTMQTVVVE